VVAGFRTFTAGDVLTASQVNSYLMKQSVMVFASSSARDTGLAGNLVEGMVVYLEDSDRLTVYTGTVWRVLEEGVQTWTPTLTATVTNPDLRTGVDGVASGHYIRQGRMVTVWARLRFGTVAPDPGEGVYIVSLPFASTGVLASTGNALGSAIGSGHLRRDSDGGLNRTIGVQLRSSTSVQFMASSNGWLTHASPWSWTNGDQIAFTATYPIA
jgi:hypothetical protein